MMRAKISTTVCKIWVPFLLGGLLLTGCDMEVKNLTPSVMVENPSQIYTFTLQTRARQAHVLVDTIQPNIVIDGQIFPMRASEMGPNLWEFEYRLPPGRTDGAYYFLVNYELTTSSGRHLKEDFTELFRFTVARRYTLTLEVDRAPVGTSVGILGRGFTRQDSVLVAGQPAQTVFESATSLRFFVPPVPANQVHQVLIQGPEETMDVGSLRVDPATIQVVPQSLSLRTGERRMLVFSVPSPAPPGGLTIEVTTDMPASIIMPEVVIPSGARSVNVPVEGGQRGQGSLFVEMPGYSELRIPVSVN